MFGHSEATLGKIERKIGKNCELQYYYIYIITTIFHKKTCNSAYRYVYI